MVIGLPVLLLAMVAGIVAAVTSGGGNTGANPGGTAAAPREAAVTKGAKWITGPSGTLLATVNADLGRLAAAVRAGHRNAAETAGAQLATDAKAALRGPMPPADAKVYQSGLQEFERAGGYSASGRFSQAAPLLSAGGIAITKVTAEVNTPAAVNPPAAVNGSNG